MTVIDSVYPCTEYLTFGPWIYLVPQIYPKSVLMLGYSGGTVAGLIYKLYGDDIPITAIDIEEPKNNEYLDRVDFIQADAQEFIENCGYFEVVIVDLWDYEPPDFIFTDKFVADVASKCDYLIVHAMNYSDMSAYDHLRKVKTLGLDYGARFHYFMINRIARLPIR